MLTLPSTSSTLVELTDLRVSRLREGAAWRLLAPVRQGGFQWLASSWPPGSGQQAVGGQWGTAQQQLRARGTAAAAGRQRDLGPPQAAGTSCGVPHSWCPRACDTSAGRCKRAGCQCTGRGSGAARFMSHHHQPGCDPSP